MKKSLILSSLALSLFTGMVSTNVFAEGPQINAKKHPRRAEVVNRAQNEKGKNEAAAENGQITKGQEAKLNRQDNRIERQEQRDAAKNGGKITKSEQAQLNREENRVNKERSNMEQRDTQHRE